MKICTKCNQHKLLHEFGNHLTSRDGIRASCKTCENTYSKSRRYGPKREELLELDRVRVAIYRKNNPDKPIETKRKYYATDKGKESKRREEQAYKASGKRKLSELRRASNKLSEARVQARLRYAHKKRSAAKNMGELDTLVLTEAVSLMRLRKSMSNTDWHVDHIIPVSKGGLTVHDNLQVVPALWNRQKSNKHQQRFFAA